MFPGRMIDPALLYTWFAIAVFGVVALIAAIYYGGNALVRAIRRRSADDGAPLPPCQPPPYRQHEE